MVIQFNVFNRYTGAVQFTAEIECADDAPNSVKIGLAVRWAITARANLAGADLAGANLAGADLAGAYLAGAYLARAYLAGAYLADANLADADLAGANLAGQPFIDGGLRSDGYRFILSNFGNEGLVIRAGCRRFESFGAARAHWKRTRDGTPLGDETFAILDHMERIATLRGILSLPGQVP